MMKRIFMSVIFCGSSSALAGQVPEVCVSKAKENVEAISRIMYAPKKISLRKTKILTSLQDSPNSFSIEIMTYDASSEPLNCIYQAKMMSNRAGECWLTDLSQTECSQ